MAWETRKGQTYYYHARRVNGQVCKEYLGKGVQAEEAASQVEASQSQREAWREKKRVDQTAEATIRELDLLCDTLTHAAMAVAGIFHHRGEWRRKRDYQEH